MAAELLAQAVSFAARAHAGHLRKDGRTPYIAHPMRVCVALAMIFDVNDHNVLAAALLHDTIEDTKTDFDDLSEEFGEDIATLVAAMTKDKRLRDVEREQRYVAQIIAGGCRVQVLKLADIYDNLADVDTLPTDHRKSSLARARYYLSALESALMVETRAAFTIVHARFGIIQKRHR